MHGSHHLLWLRHAMKLLPGQDWHSVSWIRPGPPLLYQKEQTQTRNMHERVVLWGLGAEKPSALKKEVEVDLWPYRMIITLSHWLELSAQNTMHLFLTINATCKSVAALQTSFPSRTFLKYFIQFPSVKFNGTVWIQDYITEHMM